ncbi:uncharacterized PE-PGRS family protein PE_PGRS54-like [Grus americana]|uniref:uncharacterized PE-PGRS family protein PE_PGRS54-like n=1 Tax=Grus americana TaxID=9117 RepID=UPI002408601E|nr:uncharacterized PE-PGRS family protein PE_PGRS54-like [Grus americana]
MDTHQGLDMKKRAGQANGQWESWGKPGRTGDHPKSGGEDGDDTRPSGSRLPHSPPLEAAESPPPGSCGPSPGDGGPRGELGGGGGSARAAARGKLRRGTPGLAPPPSRAPCPEPGRGRSERSFAARKRPGTGGEAAGGGGGGGGGGAAGPRSFPRGLLSPAGPEPPSPGGAPSPARSDSLLTKAKRGAAGGGAVRAAGWHRRRAGGRAGGVGGAEAAGGTEKWLELGGCGGGCNFAENTRRDADAAGTGRDQVAVEISSGGERAFGAKCGCGRSARGITVPRTEAERPSAGRPRGRRELNGRRGGTRSCPLLFDCWKRLTARKGKPVQCTAVGNRSPSLPEPLPYTYCHSPSRHSVQPFNLLNQETV